MNIIENYPLLKLNTFAVDVKAKYFISINTVNELIELTKTKVFKDLQLLILGGGSNILFTKDFDGLVILNNIKGKEIIDQTKESIFLKIGAGENWHELVMYTWSIWNPYLFLKLKCGKYNFNKLESITL